MRALLCGRLWIMGLLMIVAGIGLPIGITFTAVSEGASITGDMALALVLVGAAFAYLGKRIAQYAWEQL